MFGNRALVVLWGGELASRLGESIFQIALLWYLLERTESSALTGLVAMLGTLPALVVGVWSGVLVDRRDLRAVLLGADAARAVLALAIPGLALAGALPLAALAALAFLLTSASAFFNPARDALIPRLARPSELLPANALVQSAWQFSLLVGPFLAALLLPWMATVRLFLAVAAAFAVSLALLLALPPAPPLAGAAGPGAGSPWRAAGTGLRYLAGERRVFWLWALTLANNFLLMGPVMVGMPTYVRRHLGGTGSDFALIEGTYAGGMILATWLLARYGTRRDPLRVLFWALVYDGLTYVPLLWVQSLEGALLTVLVHSLGIPAITISRLTALQRMVAPEMRGRVFAYFHLAVAGMTALSIGATGLVLERLPAHHLFPIIGVACAGTGIVGLLLPVFRERQG
ncbi:MAG: MFS transporter [Candidatus Lambdaproteobacteria bacterium]|nr:MFS transporter [Candidatus Lambdaproteobacteria bacterium]